MDNFNISAWLKKQYLTEAEQPISGNNIEKIDFAFVDGTQMHYGTYIYLKNSPYRNWDEKLNKEKTQDLLNSLGIDIPFNYSNVEKIIQSLESQGIQSMQSEFDVS